MEELLRTYVEKLPILYQGIRDEDSSTKECFENLLRARIWSALSHPNLLKIEGNEHELLRQDPRFDFMREASEQVASIWRGLVEEGQQAKVFREDIDVELVLRLMMSLITSTVGWYRPGKRYSKEVIVDHIVDMSMTAAPRHRRPQCPIQTCYRDITMVTKHAGVDLDGAAEIAGRLALGLEAGSFLL